MAEGIGGRWAGVSGNDFMEEVAFYLPGKGIHRRESGRKKEEQSYEHHQVCEVLQAVQMLKELQVAKCQRIPNGQK